MPSVTLGLSILRLCDPDYSASIHPHSHKMAAKALAILTTSLESIRSRNEERTNIDAPLKSFPDDFILYLISYPYRSGRLGNVIFQVGSPPGVLLLKNKLDWGSSHQFFAIPRDWRVGRAAGASQRREANRATWLPLCREDPKVLTERPQEVTVSQSWEPRSGVKILCSF